MIGIELEFGGVISGPSRLAHTKARKTRETWEREHPGEIGGTLKADVDHSSQFQEELLKRVQTESLPEFITELRRALKRTSMFDEASPDDIVRVIGDERWKIKVFKYRLVEVKVEGNNAKANYELRLPLKPGQDEEHHQISREIIFLRRAGDSWFILPREFHGEMTA